MTTVNDFTDILRIIREQPEWGDALRSALLSKEVLEMPQRLAALTVAFTEFAENTNKRLAALESNVAELKDGQTRLEGDVAGLKDGQARLEGDVAELKDGQARLESDVAGLKDGQARLEGDVAELKDGQARLEGDVARLEGRVGNLRGNSYEQKIGNIISSIMSERMNLLVRVLKRANLDDDSEFFDLLHDAQRRGIISRQERDAAGNADIVLQERRQPRDTAAYIVIEVSTTVASDDIARSAERAAILQRATGTRTIPVVVCDNFDDDRQQLAQERNVTLITVGE